jgi:hypothetical protein
MLDRLSQQHTRHPVAATLHMNEVSLPLAHDDREPAIL